MSESIISIRFENFRGLPNSDFKLKGKSLVLLGSNGKGKSALVDGIEFLFSGRVNRFVGSGTGSIDHDDAVQHIKKLGVPKVSLSLSPSNGLISRSLGADYVNITGKESVKHYVEQHPGSDSFILRRDKILDFIRDQDADRYRKFIQLLGVSNIDTLQRNFVDAEKQVRESVQRAKTAHLTKLAAFRDPISKFAPQNLNHILVSISDGLVLFGLERLSLWSDAEVSLPLLKVMRPEVNKEKIDSLTRAIISLETPLSVDIGADIASANALLNKLTELDASSDDAPRSNIISEGTAYLNSHPGETNCPLCEKHFEKPLSEILSRLGQRSEALRELRETVANRRAVVGRVLRYAENIDAQLRKDLEHAVLLDPESVTTLRNARASSLRWSRLLKRDESQGGNLVLVVPPLLLTLAQTRLACTASLNAQKAAIEPPDTSKLEAAITLLERGIASYADIASAENAIISAEEMSRRATLVKDAFSRAREYAIQKVFEQIAETVLDFYRMLHDLDERNDQSECTALELKPTARAAAGGLRLAIQFLGLASSKDPRAFLSEGHLDSLGLCIFLATVRIFNPPGSLLVLDDVLTSIDKEHRRRVGELLFQKFSGYQIIMTTHDEHWRDLLQSSSRAWGIQDKWVFVELESWTVDSGPSLSELDSSWEFVITHLTEVDYRELGGPFRLIFEDFLKRVAVKLELKVRFRIDGKYTAGEFLFAGIQDVIRNSLIKIAPDEEMNICTDVGRVFGQGDLINYLSHDNPGRLEVTFDQAKDFVQGLLDLTKRCEANKLIRGR